MIDVDGSEKTKCPCRALYILCPSEVEGTVHRESKKEQRERKRSSVLSHPFEQLHPESEHA